MKKKFKVLLLIMLVSISAFAIERFTFVNIDITDNPYSLYATSVKAERGKLLGYEFIKTINSSEINDLFPEIDENVGEIRNIPKYDIDLYRINYTSIFLYEIVTLSGLIVVPHKSVPLSHIQYHHGTLFPFPGEYGEGSLDAPSLYKGIFPETTYSQYESRLFGNYLGSYGYLVSLPDYIGYGVSNNYEHTYSVHDRLAEQSVDMIFASRAFCGELNISLDGKTFLSGWSEGGAATLATQKLLESEYSEQLNITANAPLAAFSTIGIYSKFLISLAPLDIRNWDDGIDELLWAVYAINRYTDDKPLDTQNIFQFEVNNQSDVLNNRPTNSPSKALKYFIKDRDKLISKFVQNDLSDGWTPKAPIYLHHGTKDENVYYSFNADTTVRNLNKLGGNVELVKYEGHDHYTLDKLYLLNIIEEFGKY